eukprot:INCI14247.3.p1 GENE.INCI14247.3~~INCI14247.3.p1  ORF type:complete len:477 (-),score=61.23 INCI14247.3:958-2388(-)
MSGKPSIMQMLTAYSTTKRVRVVDWRLGLIHIGAITAILVYVLLYEMLYKSKAFSQVLPVSTVRMSLQEPVLPGCVDVMDPDPKCDNTLTGVRTLPYCLQAPESIGKYWKFPRFDCEYMDAIGAQDMIADKSISVTTRISEYVQNRTCFPDDDLCPKIWTSLPMNSTTGSYVRKTFVPGVENFTLLFDANAYGSTTTTASVSWSLEATALNTTGKLYVQQSHLGDELCARAAANNLKPTTSRFGDYPADESTVSPCYIEPNKALDGSSYDTFAVRDLLAAAKLDLSRATGFNNHSTRYEGTIVVIKLVYSNIRPWGFPSNTAEYTYEIDWLEESKFKVVDTTFQNETTRYLQDRHGVWFVVTVNGAFMYFDGQNFIVQMSSFFSLLAIATFAVDFIMVYILPERVAYKAGKYTQVQSDHEHCKGCFARAKSSPRRTVTAGSESINDDGSAREYDKLPSGHVQGSSPSSRRSLLTAP